METAEQRNESTEEVGAVSMSPSTSLLDCPHCGSGDVGFIGHYYAHSGAGRWCVVGCRQCGACVMTMAGAVEAEERWNRRQSNGKDEAR